MNSDNNYTFCGFPLTSDYNDLKKNLMNKKEANKASNKILDKTRQYDFDLEKPGIVRDGTLTTNIDGLRYDCLIKRHETKKLYVFLHGGRWISADKLAEIPSFSKWQYYPILDGNMLCIEDPMYHYYADLVTGWFYGTSEHNYRESTAKLIMKIAKLMNVENKNIVIFSSRAGTSSSMHIGSFIKECTVIAIDPIIDLEKAGEGSKFETITGINLKQKDAFGRNNLREMLLESRDTHFVLLCNILSKDIYEKQILPLCDAANIAPKMGFNPIKNIMLWLYEAPGAPKPQNSSDDEDLLRMILYTADKIKSNDVSGCGVLCDMVNSIWYTHYAQKRRIHELSKH